MSQPPKDVRERFMRKVQKTDDPNGCWLWTAGQFLGGYGAFFINGGMRRAHRISYEWFVGPVPAGHFVCHHCDTPRCVRPEHLYAGTREDNTEDMLRRGRVASGKRNGTRTRPETHGLHHHPEKAARGKAAKKSDLTTEDVQSIRQRHARGETQTDLARVYGVTQAAIWRIIRRQTWAHVS